MKYILISLLLLSLNTSAYELSDFMGKTFQSETYKLVIDSELSKDGKLKAVISGSDTSDWINSIIKKRQIEEIIIRTNLLVGYVPKTSEYRDNTAMIYTIYDDDLGSELCSISDTSRERCLKLVTEK